jgi:NhaP-type Na+/H+ or K+/H+ antiporter
MIEWFIGGVIVGLALGFLIGMWAMWVVKDIEQRAQQDPE